MMSYKDVLVVHKFGFTMEKLQAHALALGYLFFMWNGRVYNSANGQSINRIEKDVK